LLFDGHCRFTASKKRQHLQMLMDGKVRTWNT
jgi:hypothetical protein